MKKILEISRDDTGQRCYRSLRRLIMYAQLPAGERLGEVEWSQRLGAHRSAFREALVLLAHEGLLRRGERGGFFVPCFDHNDIVEIVEARLVIELGALKLIAKKGPSAEKLAPLRELCENMRRLLGSDLLLGFVEADRKFHETLVGLVSSSRLNTMYLHAPLPQLLPGLPVTEIEAATYMQSLSEHQQLVELLEEQRYGDAHELLEAHISRLLFVSV